MYTKEDLELISKWIKDSDCIVFYTGAGMSVASGIPTFRRKYGLSRLCMDLLFFTLGIPILSFVLLDHYGYWNWLWMTPIWIFLTILSISTPFIGAYLLATPFGWNYFPKISWIIFKLFFFDVIVRAKHNKGHGFMKYISTILNKEVHVVTANVDCLENDINGVTCHQIHGSIRTFFCTTCKEKFQLELDKPLPWLNPKCTKCNTRTNRTGCRLFNDSGNPYNGEFSSSNSKKEALYNLINAIGYGSISSFNRMMKKCYPDPSKICNFVIGTSGTVLFGAGSARGKIIEINITDEPTTEVMSLTSEYKYIQAPQEEFLNKLKIFMKDTRSFMN